MLMTDGGAHGLMDLVECLDKLISEASITFFHRYIIYVVFSIVTTNCAVANLLSSFV